MGGKRYAGIRASKSGKGIHVDFRFRGVRCRETLKMPPTPENMKYANHYRASILHEIGQGVFDYAKHFPESARAVLFCGNRTQRITVRQAMREYLQGKAKAISPSTLRSYASANRCYIMPRWGDVFLDDVTVAAVRTWISAMDCSNKRINNVLVPFRGMMNDAFMDGVIASDPMERVKNLPLNTPEPDPFNDAEIAAILDQMQPAAAHMFKFAFWTGLRTGELIAMQWDDVDMFNKIVRVRRSTTEKHTKTTKTRAGMRDIELLVPAFEALQAMKELTFLAGKEVWQNPKTGEAWTNDAQIRQTCWRYALKKAGVRYRCPYQTRHTFASKLLSTGANPMWVAAQMGHSDWGMIRKRYGRWLPQEASEAERMNLALFGHQNGANGQDLVNKKHG